MWILAEKEKLYINLDNVISIQKSGHDSQFVTITYNGGGLNQYANRFCMVGIDPNPKPIDEVLKHVAPQGMMQIEPQVIRIGKGLAFEPAGGDD